MSRKKQTLPEDILQPDTKRIEQARAILQDMLKSQPEGEDLEELEEDLERQARLEEWRARMARLEARIFRLEEAVAQKSMSINVELQTQEKEAG